MPLTLRDHKRRLASLQKDRNSYMSHWQDLSRFFLPRKGDALFGAENRQNRGDKRNQQIVDSTVRYVITVFQAGMMSGLTSPSRPWWRLTTPDPDLMEYPPVREWLYQVESRQRDWLAKSNLYSVLPSLYGDESVFASGAMGCFGPISGVPGANSPPVFSRYPIGAYLVAQNADTQVDTFYYEREMRVEQLVQKFGHNCSENVRNLYKNNQFDQTVKVVYAITPNTDHTGQYVDNRNLPFNSVWFETGRTDDENAFLSQSGFHDFAIMVPRWEVDPDTAYGATCPGMDMLGDAKGLQFQQKTKARIMDKLGDPPLQAPESLRGKTISMLPGDITYFNESEGAKGVRSLYDFQPQIQPMLEDIGEIQDRLRKGFFTDLFLLLSTSASDPQRTAYEVAQLKEEKLLMLGPALENNTKGLHAPLINRTFGMMLRSGMLPPPPPELSGMDLKIEFISILAQAQRMVGLSSVDRLVGFVSNAATMKPDVADKVDFDQAVDEYAEGLGVPPNLVVSDAKVAQTRAARAKQEQLQNAMAQAPNLAGAAKDLSQTDMQGDTAMSRLTNMVTGQ